MRESEIIGSREHQLQKLNLLAGLDKDGLKIAFDEDVKIYRGPNPAWQKVVKPVPPTQRDLNNRFDAGFIFGVFTAMFAIIGTSLLVRAGWL